MKRSNWIYKLYSFSPNAHYDFATTCQIIGGCFATIGLTLLFLFFFLGLLFIGFALLIGIAELILNLFSVGSFMLFLGGYGMLGLSLLFIIASVITGLIIIGGFTTLIGTLHFVSIAHKGWKEKICPLITFED
jgi:hypothetical protein